MKHLDRIICTLATAWAALQCAGQITGVPVAGSDAMGDHCGTSTSHEQRLAGDPAYAHRHLTFEETVQHNALAGGPGGDRDLVVIPVVVHIIHDGGPENISDAQVLTAIEHLNMGFANTGYYDPGTGVDTEIQVCVAMRDPNGDFTTGINRVQSPLTDMIKETEDQAVKSLIDWDPLSYVNIWVVRSITSQSQGPGVVGYAFLPAAHGTSYDGIVVEADYFGTSAANDVVIIHEVGHYLGLYHTFEGECPNADCLSDGDRVCDTPPDASTASIACDGTINTCTSDPQDESLNNPFRPIGNGGLGDQPDQYLNYMDYGAPECKTMFTQGQKDRMHVTLADVRSSLLQSYACQSPCLIPFDASFALTPSSPVVIGTQLILTNTTGPATGYQWAVDGAWFSNNINETYSLTEEGLFTFTLTADDSVNFCWDSSSVVVEVYCPGEASFTTTGNDIPAGGHVIFTNTSTSSTAFEWYLDGDLHAITEDDSVFFDTPGIYTMYLVAQTPDCPNVSTTATIEVGLCVADGHRMNWHFGNHAGLDFNSGGPVALTNSSMLCAEGSTSISDADGELLFYSNGKTVYDRNNFIMPNGTGLLGGQTTSARNQALAARRPRTPGQYVLFTLDQFEDDCVNGLRYSVIDMSLNGGMGGVTSQKNVLIDAPTNEETMAGVYHANGEDIWLFKPDVEDDILIRYRMDSALNITTSVIDLPGYLDPFNVVISRSGKKLHLTMRDDGPDWSFWSRIFDLDPATGELSDPIDLELECCTYLPDFSPDGSKLYVPHADMLTQFDLSLTTQAAIQASAVVVATFNGAKSVRSAPDGKVYFSEGVDALSVINAPNEAGTACDVQIGTIGLAGENVIVGLPLFMAGFQPGEGVYMTGADSICIDAAAAFQVLDPDTGCAYAWSVNGVPVPAASGDTLALIAPLNADSVLVRLTRTCECGVNTTTRWLRYVEAQPFTLANDTAICITDPLVLDPGTGYTDHLWQDGSTASSYTVTTAGTYWLQVTDPLGCSVSDTVVVALSEFLPPLDLGADDTLCAGLVQMLDAGSGYLEYQWQDGSMEQTFTAWQAGTYWATVSNGCGTATDTIVLLSGEAGPLSLGADSLLCEWTPQVLEAPPGWDHYFWQDGSTGTSLTAETPGVYWLAVTNALGCSTRDTIEFIIDDAPPLLICPPDTSVLLHGDGTTEVVQLPLPIASDPCGLTLTNDITGTEDASGGYPLGVTTITWTATDGLGNTVTCTTTVTVYLPDGIEERANSSIIVFPNPGEGIFHVRWKGPAPLELEVIDALGRSVHRQAPNVSGNTTTLDLSRQASGFYTLRSIVDGRTARTSFVIGDPPVR